MIKPTIGRVIWYYEPGKPVDAQPWAAFITYVHGDTCINVGGFDANGKPFSDTSVLLIHDEASYGKAHERAWACWMPYQKTQAAKIETDRAGVTKSVEGQNTWRGRTIPDGS